jgi:hypothetical protein
MCLLFLKKSANSRCYHPQFIEYRQKQADAESKLESLKEALGKLGG